MHSIALAGSHEVIQVDHWSSWLLWLHAKICNRPLCGKNITPHTSSHHIPISFIHKMRKMLECESELARERPQAAIRAYSIAPMQLLPGADTLSPSIKFQCSFLLLSSWQPLNDPILHRQNMRDTLITDLKMTLHESPGRSLLLKKAVGLQKAREFLAHLL